MARAPQFLAAVFWLILPLTSHALDITSPASLGLADFWVWIEGTNGAFNRVEARDSAPVSLNIADPVIGGVPISGHLIVSNELKSTGPATVANAVLDHPGPTVLNTQLDLRSLVTFDVAVLGAGPTAQVRVQGSGVGGAAHGSPAVGGTFSLSSGFVTIYDTDVNGNIGTALHFWQIRDNMTTTPIDAAVMLTTNHLYKVIVRSYADIDFNQASSFSGQYAYMYVDPTLTSLTPGAEVFVSSNLTPVPEPANLSLLLCGLVGLTLVARYRRTIQTSSARRRPR